MWHLTVQERFLGSLRLFSLHLLCMQEGYSLTVWRFRLPTFWSAHKSRRIDPKYHLFKRQESSYVPEGWVTARIGEVMQRRLEQVHPEDYPDRTVQVMTISQAGEIRPREAGKGQSPPGMAGYVF